MCNMFSGCSKLELLDIRKIIDNIKSLNVNTAGIFSGCTALAKDICIAGGITVTLEGQIGVNIYLTACENLAKVIMSGPNGDIVFNSISEFESVELPVNGSLEKAYKFTYPVNATQSNENITLKAYDKNNQQIIICKANDQICDRSQVSCTVRDYLKNLKKDDNGNNGLQSIRNKFVNYTVNVLENYLNAADNYFNGTEHNINDIDSYINNIVPYVDGIVSDSTFTANFDNVDYKYFKEKLKDLLVPIENFKPDFSDDIKLSLVLNSTISLRIYTDSNDVKLNGANCSLFHTRGCSTLGKKSFKSMLNT